jgi:hypothetical protein
LWFGSHNLQQEHQIPGRPMLKIKEKADVPNKEDSLENAKASRKV